jgi:hypothetical protein
MIDPHLNITPALFTDTSRSRIKLFVWRGILNRNNYMVIIVNIDRNLEGREIISTTQIKLGSSQNCVHRWYDMAQAA